MVGSFPHVDLGFGDPDEIVFKITGIYVFPFRGDKLDSDFVSSSGPKPLEDDPHNFIIEKMYGEIFRLFRLIHFRTPKKE